MLPNFLIVGAEKAGTTTLAATLSHHMEIFISVPKEPSFFSREENWNKGILWYQALFENVGPTKAIGEASPGYTWAPASKQAPKRILNTLGDIKYIYITRHPIDRLISHYRHALFHRWLDDNTTFKQALEKMPQLKECSRYYYQLEQYMPYTAKEQWLILTLEELLMNTNSVLREVFNFLNVNTEVAINLVPSNVTDTKKRMPRWYLAFHKRLKKAPLLHEMGRWAKERCWFLHIEDKIGTQIHKPEIPNSLYQELLTYYAADVDKLCEFTGKPLKEYWRFG